MSDKERIIDENDLERQSEHLEDSNFNPKWQMDEIQQANEEEVPRKKCNRQQKKIFISKIVSTLAEQVQMLVEENGEKNVVLEDQAKKERRIRAEARAPATNYSHSHSELCNSRLPVTHLKSEGIDLLRPPMSLKVLVTKLTPTKGSPMCLKGEEADEAALEVLGASKASTREASVVSAARGEHRQQSYLHSPKK
ncbi:hypothetical protein Fot_05722 [Forsythia ovata]|uniref:Uncharacterized protein n=1 Tax=Forsythia ovata TaxID=205694 RepID=A0ABD1WR08_9LAMI